MRILLFVLVLLASPSALLAPPGTPPGTPPATPPWSWPTDGPRVVVRPFLAPASDYGAGHRGVDLSAASTVLRAPADGVVHFAGTVVDRGVLSIDHGAGVLSSYEPVTTTLHDGGIVRRGQVIGEIDPGLCARLCVHVGVRVNGEYVSPMLYLGTLRRAVLLPTRALGSPSR